MSSINPTDFERLYNCILNLSDRDTKEGSFKTSSNNDSNWVEFDNENNVLEYFFDKPVELSQLLEKYGGILNEEELKRIIIVTALKNKTINNTEVATSDHKTIPEFIYTI